jgi:hypothetical protein
MDCDENEAWFIEGTAGYCGLNEHVFDLVRCVELPLELLAHAEAAEQDPEYETQSNEWLEYLMEQLLLLPIEQSCNAEGLLLPWDMRAVRLSTLPADLLAKLHFFFDSCPRHTRALLVHEVFWLVRFERLQRRDTVAWTVDDEEIPEEDDEPAFFRPNLMTVRRYSS